MNVGASYTFESNVRASGSDSQSDHVFRISPSFSLSRNVGLIQASANTGFSYQWAAETGELISLNPNLSLGLNFPIGRQSDWSYGGGFSYSRSTGGNPFVNEVIQTDVYNADATLSYTLSEKTSLSGNTFFGYTDVSDAPKETADTISAGVGLGLSYRLSPRLNASGNFSTGYSRSLTRDAVSSQSYNWSFGFNGEVTDQLSGSLGLGWSFRQAIDGDSSNTYAPFVSANLSWQITEKTSAGLGASTDFPVAVTNQTAQSYGASLNLSHSLATRWSLNSNLSYGLTILEGGENSGTDHALGAQVGLSASATEDLGFSTSFRYEVNASDRDDAQFHRYSLNLSASYGF